MCWSILHSMASVTHPTKRTEGLGMAWLTPASCVLLAAALAALLATDVAEDAAERAADVAELPEKRPR